MPTTSPNMSMQIPIVGVTPAPDWASLIVSCFNVIDAHDHTTGAGLPITPGAININSALTFGGNNATALRAARFSAQVSAIAATGAELNEIYVAGVDLYYNDGAGNQIRITQSGSVSGSAGTITGLPSGTASAAYSAGSAKFIFQSATNTSADMDFGAAIMRNATASSFGLTLQPPTLASNYSITLPPLPVSQKIMTLDASGIMTAAYVTDNSTLEVSANSLRVKNNGITPAKLSVLNQTLSSSTGVYTNATTGYTTVTSASITTAGSPVYIALQSDGSGSISQLDAFPSGAVAVYQILRNSTEIATGLWTNAAPVSSIVHMDTLVTAGTYTYTLKAKVLVSGSGKTVEIDYAKLLLREAWGGY